MSLSLSSPEDGNRSRFRNVVFCSYLEYRTMDKVQKPIDSMVLSCFAEEIEYKYKLLLIPNA
jgi:hypothetical protein